MTAKRYGATAYGSTPYNWTYTRLTASETWVTIITAILTHLPAAGTGRSRVDDQPRATLEVDDRPA